MSLSAAPMPKVFGTITNPIRVQEINVYGIVQAESFGTPVALALFPGLGPCTVSYEFGVKANGDV
jgi:hypothetical protein